MLIAGWSSPSGRKRAQGMGYRSPRKVNPGLPRDLVDLRSRIPKLGDDGARRRPKPRRRETEAVAGRTGERHRHGHRQHLPLRGMLAPLEDPGFAEIGV